MCQSSVVFEIFGGPAESSRLTDVPVQYIISWKICVDAKSHKNHHRYQMMSTVAKESGGHCTRKHLKTWFGTSASLSSYWSSARLVQILTSTLYVLF